MAWGWVLKGSVRLIGKNVQCIKSIFLALITYLRLIFAKKIYLRFFYIYQIMNKMLLIVIEVETFKGQILAHKIALDSLDCARSCQDLRQS